MNKIRLVRPAAATAALSLLATTSFGSSLTCLTSHTPFYSIISTTTSPRPFSLSCSHWKKQKKPDSLNKNDNDHDDDDDEYEDLEEDSESSKSDQDLLDSVDTSDFPPGYKLMTKFVASLRFDTILAAGLGVSRNKIDGDFYSSRLRLNGEKVLKKSMLVSQGSALDLVAEMDDKLKKRRIKRVLLCQILDTKSKKSNRSKVIMAVWKNGMLEDEAYKSISGFKQKK